MKNTEFIPADFDTHGRLRLPFLFWCVLLLQARTWVLFLMAGASRQQGDALYYASYIVDKTFNPFVAYPIVAGYFILLTLGLIALFGVINRRLNRHLPGAAHRLRYRPKLIR